MDTSERSGPRYHVHGMAPSDGETRITKGPGFTLHGGDKETHERMQDHAMILRDELKKKGTTIENSTCEQLREAVERARERME